MDPLNLISASSASGLSGLQGPGAVRPGEAGTPAAGSFKDLLMDNLRQVNDLQNDAHAAVEDLQAGRRNDLETVLMATAKADTAFRMLLQLRNKVMDAYEEVKQIRV